jgi:hypothetical protein
MLELVGGEIVTDTFLVCLSCVTSTNDERRVYTYIVEEDTIKPRKVLHPPVKCSFQIPVLLFKKLDHEVSRCDHERVANVPLLQCSLLTV